MVFAEATTAFRPKQWTVLCKKDAISFLQNKSESDFNDRLLALLVLPETAYAPPNFVEAVNRNLPNKISAEKKAEYCFEKCSGKPSIKSQIFDETFRLYKRFQQNPRLFK